MHIKNSQMSVKTSQVSQASGFSNTRNTEIDMNGGKDVSLNGVDLFLQINIMELLNSDSIFDIGFF
jgi:hypothetical protein